METGIRDNLMSDTQVSDAPPPQTSLTTLTGQRLDHIFPTLTPAQMARIEAHGRRRTVRRGEVLANQGDSGVPFYVVIDGYLEIVKPSGSGDVLLAVHGPGQFTGEVNMLSGRRALARAGPRRR